MAQRTLSIRELNRTTLNRQLLLERSSQLDVSGAVSHLAGLQAQQAIAPYIGLWTRLAGFNRGDLAVPIEQRAIVKATLMRSTLHLFTAKDYSFFRATLQPALAAAQQQIAKRRAAQVDVGNLVRAARKFISDQPRSYAEITSFVKDLEPEGDPGSMRYSIRMHLPMVQVPADTTWSFPGQPKFTLADDWLAVKLDEKAHLRDLVLRFLTAFGPATIQDFQTWSGLNQPKDVWADLKSELVVYRDDRKRELLDVTGAPEPEGDTEAPVHFLPEYDNLLRAYKVRTRVVADEHKPKVYLPALRVASTILVNGFVAGTWKIEKARGNATLAIEPFTAFPAKAKREALAEAEKLVKFAEPSAKSHAVRYSG